MVNAIQTVLLWACAAVLVLIASIAVLAGMGKAAERARRRLRGASAAVVALAAVCVLFARKGRVTVADPYIRDAGSYLANDVAHVAVAKRTALLPDATAILVYARPVDSTDAADWVRLSPRLTFADHPHDYVLPNATNYNVVVAADFTPAPIVLTNEVWQMRGFTIPGTGKAAFPNTKVTRKEERP